MGGSLRSGRRVPAAPVSGHFWWAGVLGSGPLPTLHTALKKGYGGVDSLPYFSSRTNDRATSQHDEAAPSTSSFDLVFPADLTPKQVLSWVHSLAGLLVSGPGRLFGVRSLTLELRATDKGLHYRLAAPKAYAGYLANQLRTHLPGIRVTPLSTEPLQSWTLAVEFGLRRHLQTLYVPDPISVSTSLLAGLREIGRGETCLVQLVLTPALHERPPAQTRQSSGSGLRLLGGMNVTLPRQANDRILDQRQKLEGPNMLAVLRVGIAAASEQRARHLLASVTSALGSTRSARNSLVRRPTPQGIVRRRLVARTAPMVYPMQLTAVELVALLGWPIGSPVIAGLPQARTRHLPATESILRRGRVIAASNFPGAERPLALTPADSCKHLHVCGPTGTGKTVLLANLVAQDVAAGYGVIVIEGKGGDEGLFARCLKRVPKSRLDDAIILDVTDTDYPVAFNVLSQGSPRVVVEELCALFEYLYRDTRGVWTREVLYHGLSTLITRPESTFVDLAPLLVPMNPSEEAWRDDLIRSLTDRELRNFWQRFGNQPRATQDRIAQPVMDRIWQLNARPEIRNIIGQSRSSFTMQEVVSSGKILLVNLAGLGQQTASLAGTLLMNALWRAVQGTRHKQPLFLYLDEFQDFLQLPINPADMFAKARGFGLGITAAHQDLGQLPVELRQAVLANARSKVVFQCAADDARTFAREFGRAVSDEDFMNLGPYEVLMRLATAEGVSQPVTGMSLPPSEPTELEHEVRTRSRQRYGRRLADVEAEIDARRHATEAPPKKRPRVGGTTWE
jgi:hypothetical protein